MTTTLSLILIRHICITFFILLISFYTCLIAQETRSPYIINNEIGERFTSFNRNNYGLFPFLKNMNYARLFNNQNGKIDAQITLFDNKDNSLLYKETNYTPDMLFKYIEFIDRYYNSKNGNLFKEQGFQVVINFNDGNSLLSQIISVRDSTILISKNQIYDEKEIAENTNMMSSVLLKDINSIAIKKDNKIWWSVISGGVVGCIFGYYLNSLAVKMSPEDLKKFIGKNNNIHPPTLFTLTFGTLGTIIGALIYASDNTMPVKELGSIPVRPYAIYPHQMLEPEVLKNIP